MAIYVQYNLTPALVHARGMCVGPKDSIIAWYKDNKSNVDNLLQELRMTLQASWFGREVDGWLVVLCRGHKQSVRSDRSARVLSLALYAYKTCGLTSTTVFTYNRLITQPASPRRFRAIAW